ncbi:hypothetical protein Tco_0788781 [Tanacetum coccineum]
MDTLSLVSEYLKDLEECMDDGDSKVAKEAKLFDALEHKSVVIEVDNQKIAIFTKAPLRAFGEPFMRYSIPCKFYGQEAWDAELNLADSENYVTEEVLGNMGFVCVNFCDYGRKMGEPSIMFGRDFLVTTKSQVNFGLGEIRMNLTKFKEGIEVINLTEEVGSSSEEVVKMGKANRNKGYNINKLTPLPSLKVEEISPTSAIPPQPIYHPLTQKQKEKMKEVLDIKYKELEESKPILEVLENYVVYKKKLDEISIGKERLNKKEFSEEGKVGIIEQGLPKKMYDPRNYVLPLNINGVVKMVALVDTGASAMGEVKNARIQIGYQAYVVDLLILDIPVDLELPLLLGRPFLRTYEAIIDMGRGSFEVGRDEYGNVKYGPIAPSFIDIEDDMKGHWGNEGYETYKKIDGDGDWHARFEIVTPSGRKFNRAFKTKTTKRKLSGKFKTEDVLSRMAECSTGRQRGRLSTWKDLPSVERHAYYEKLSKLQERSFGVPRVANWRLFDSYGFEDNMREMMKLEYIYEGDGDVFVDYSWKRALSVDNEIYPEWVLEFFSTLYFDKDVDITNLMKEKGSYGLGDDDYFSSAMPDFGHSSSGYAVGGSSREAGFNDDDRDE